MRLTKYTHACVRIDHDGATLVIDPGSFSEPESVDGADAVLLTHEHADHIESETLKRTQAPIWTNAAVAAVLGQDPAFAGRVSVVGDGDEFTAAGFTIRAYGEDHAVILPEAGVPCQNTAFLVDDAIYHPGDSWTPLDRPVHTTLLPVSAPWFTTPDMVAYAREVRANQAVPIHDALLSEIGMGMAERFAGMGLGDRTPVRVLKPTESLDLG